MPLPARIRRQLRRAADVFLLPSLRLEGDIAHQARRLVLFVFLISALVVREAIEGHRAGSPMRVGVSLAYVPVATFVLVTLRRWGALVWATHTFVGSLIAMSFVVAAVTGAPAPLLALSGLAFIALLTIGREGAVWAGVTVLLAFGVVATRALGVMAARPFVYTPLAQAVDAAIVCVTTSAFAWTFVTTKQRLIDELAKANIELGRKVEEHRLAEERASAANFAKSSFLANMSHEIRTPMTAIMGFGDMLQSAELAPSERSEFVETIRRNGNHLLGIINDILDLSKVESGKLDAERIACSPQSLVADVLSSLRVSALAKGLHLEVTYATPIPASIQSDPTRVRQILTNLVSNAIKFTSKGAVGITVRCAEPDAEEPRLIFDVVDSGPGIPPEAIRNLFQPFAQGDASMTRRFGGTGLGLAISERLSRALGGRLVLASTGNTGSRFTLTLPTGTGSLAGAPMQSGEREAGPARVPYVPSGARASGRVLLAEDGPDNQMLISHYLRRAGVTSICVADSGREAVRLALAARAEGRPFDLVLMDMQMPELDGYAATRELRAAGYGAPIVALTAHAMRGDEERCRAAGCDGYMTKPIAVPAFMALVGGYVGDLAARGSAGLAA